jgi:hypothetical protein
MCNGSFVYDELSLNWDHLGNRAAIDKGTMSRPQVQNLPCALPGIVAHCGVLSGDGGMLKDCVCGGPPAQSSIGISLVASVAPKDYKM